jgi:hypothetical protein
MDIIQTGLYSQTVVDLWLDLLPTFYLKYVKEKSGKEA